MKMKHTYVSASLATDLSILNPTVSAYEENSIVVGSKGLQSVRNLQIQESYWILAK